MDDHPGPVASPVCSGVRSPEVLRRLPDLPVPVVERSQQGTLDIGPVKGGEGQHGPAAHGDPVLGPGQDRGQAASMAQGTEGGHRGLAAQGLLVAGRHGGQGVDVFGARRVFAQGPGGHLDHGVVVVEEQPGGYGPGVCAP